jgi:putative ABC transport system permease protein
MCICLAGEEERRRVSSRLDLFGTFALGIGDRGEDKLLNHLSVTTTLVSESVRGLSRNKLRSALAALGITIGIAAVVCVVAIGRAGSDVLEQQLNNLGDNLVWVEAGSRNVNGVRSGTHGMNNLTAEDAGAILREVPLIKSVSPHADGNVRLAYQNRNWSTQYRGVSPEYLEIKRWRIGEGAPFTEEQVEQSASVCLIGQTVKDQLFGTDAAVGRMMRMNNQLCEVIGVLSPKGQSGAGMDQDDTVLLPFTTAQKKLRGKGPAWVDDIMCSAVSPESVGPAIDEITRLLRQRHQIRPDQDDDFNIRRPEELIKAQLETKRTLALFLISIASISLLVGGIGIMNVMLVSVAQRTREIGVRLAVGATESAVQLQFLGEAIMLSLLGGVMGILVGIASSFIFGRLMDWPMTIPTQALVIAPLFSIAVGMFFGLYPAWRAARLDPIAALHYE